jgi:hypothetical protein
LPQTGRSSPNQSRALAGGRQAQLRDRRCDEGCSNVKSGANVSSVLPIWRRSGVARSSEGCPAGEGPCSLTARGAAPLSTCVRDGSLQGKYRRLRRASRSLASGASLAELSPARSVRRGRHLHAPTINIALRLESRKSGQFDPAPPQRNMQALIERQCHGTANDPAISPAAVPTRRLMGARQWRRVRGN